MSGAAGKMVFMPDPADESWFREGCHILELLNDPADPEVSIARARVAPGTMTRWHRLAATTERYVILSGSGEAWVGEQVPQTVGPGHVVLIPPMTRQRIFNPGPEELVFLAICTPRFTPECYQEPVDES